MSRKKKGSITEMKAILWQPLEDDKKNLAIAEKWYMDQCGIVDCSMLSGSSVLRAIVRELTECITTGRKVKRGN